MLKKFTIIKVIEKKKFFFFKRYLVFLKEIIKYNLNKDENKNILFFYKNFFREKKIFRKLILFTPDLQKIYFWDNNKTYSSGIILKFFEIDSKFFKKNLLLWKKIFFFLLNTKKKNNLIYLKPFCIRTRYFFKYLPKFYFSIIYLNYNWRCPFVKYKRIKKWVKKKYSNNLNV